jgi:hypothetical protein
MMGQRNEPPIPAPVVVFSLADPAVALKGTGHGPVLHVKTLSVKNRWSPNTSKWAQPGSNEAFSMILNP